MVFGMFGAIVGDVIGSHYENFATKEPDFCLFPDGYRFTDDTVLTVAVADWILNGGELVDRFHEYFHAYPTAVYGGAFSEWAASRRREPYNSWGNGSAMRVSPVGWSCDSLDAVLTTAEQTALVTHNHPAGIRGAQATAAAVFLARTTRDKSQIKSYIEGQFGYDLSRHLEAIRPDYSFQSSCQESVPESIIAFLESDNFEHAIRNAVSLGGDADTMACIAGAIAEAFYGDVPAPILEQALSVVDDRLLHVVNEFRNR